MAKAPDVTAQSADVLPSEWSPRRVPQDGVGITTADPITPTNAQLAERAERARAQQATCAAAQETAWLELEYTHPDDGSPMPRAPYRVRFADGSTKQGSLDGNGRARLDGLNPALAGTQVTVHFGDPAPDYRLLPVEAEPNPEYRGEAALAQLVAPRVELASTSHDLSGITLPRSPFADVPHAVDEALDFLWGVIAGAYRKDPTTGQVVGQIIVTLIPVVGQIAVVRDATAYVYRLTRPHLTTAEKIEDWIGLVLCLVALVPELGGALAGVLRLAARGGRVVEVPAEALVAVLNRLGRGNVLRFARQRLTYEAIERAALGQFNALMAKLDAIFAEIVGAPHWLVPEPALAAAGRARADLRALRGEAPGQIRAAVRRLIAPVERALQKAEMRAAERDEAGGATNGPARATAQAADPPEAGGVADETFGGGKGAAEEPARPGRASAEVIAQRRALARRFYEEQGFPPDKVNGHLNGIDFSKPVDVVSLEKGTVLEQWNFGSYQGDYYTLPGTDPLTLGIPMERTNNVTGVLERRTVREFIVQEDARALRSTAGDIDWPPYGLLKGGGQQFMTNVKGVITPRGGP